MDSESLSKRLIQPGHIRDFLVAEKKFVACAKAALDPQRYDVIPNPKDLRSIFRGVAGQRPLGLNPEAAIISKETDRRFFVEVKKQGLRGNAEERACKHHTVQFYKTLQDKYPTYDYHPYVTIFCEALASAPHYVAKFPFLIEAENYLCWVDYDEALLGSYLRERCAAWLD